MIWLMDKEHLNSLTDHTIQVNGYKTNKMVLVKKHLLGVQNILANTNMEIKKEEVFFKWKMEVFMKVN